MAGSNSKQQHQHLRKPLSDVEKTTKKTTVCVTGAAGYLASSIVARLLAAGHAVRGTVRDPTNAAKNAHLWALSGAKDKLKLFKVREKREREKEKKKKAISFSFLQCLFARLTGHLPLFLSSSTPPYLSYRPTSPTPLPSTRR